MVLLFRWLTSERIASLALLAPAVAEELVAGNRRLRRLTDKSVLEFLSLPDGQPTVSALEHAVSLVEEARRWSCRVRDEVSLLKFAVAWLSQREEVNKLLAPSIIDVSFPTDRTQEVSFREPIDNRLFRAPTWCAAREKWRFELGFVLRFIITGQSDPTATSRHPSWRENENCYRPPPSFGNGFSPRSARAIFMRL